MFIFPVLYIRPYHLPKPWGICDLVTKAVVAPKKPKKRDQKGQEKEAVEVDKRKEPEIKGGVNKSEFIKTCQLHQNHLNA